MQRSAREAVKRGTGVFGFAVLWLLATTLVCLPARAQQAAPSQASSQAPEAPKAKPFPSPEEAAAALYAAARNNDEAELLVILGPEARPLITWSDDPKDRQAQRELFAQKFDQMHRLVREPDDTVALYVGAENWPLPIPLVEYQGAWYFDAELGKQEIVYRRIGRNEAEALEVCRALVDAEKEYYAAAHQYTERFVSSGGSHDGLYWEGADAAGKSPIGPFLARAGIDPSNSKERAPFHGYYYRILPPMSPRATAGGQRPGKHGGMNEGFAILAFPAEYRSSGVMTFLMDQNGDAYEKELGPTSASLTGQIASIHPDNTWKKVE